MNPLSSARYKRLRALLLIQAGAGPAPAAPTLTASTPGLAQGESAVLTLNGGAFQLTDGNTYTLELTVTVSGTVGGVRTTRTFKNLTTVVREGGVSTISETNNEIAQGSAGGASWTLAATVGAAPDRIVYTFTTGETTAKTNITGTLVMTETANS